MRRTPLRRVSARNAQLEAKLAEARKTCEFRAYGRCEANTPACPDREHRGAHAHHIKPRSASVDHSPENLLWVCAAAHSYIHEHPAEAYDKGWLIRRYA